MIESRLKSAALEFSRKHNLRPAFLVEAAMKIGAEIGRAVEVENMIETVKREIHIRQRQNRDGIGDGHGFGYDLAEPKNYRKNGHADS